MAHAPQFVGVAQRGEVLYRAAGIGPPSSEKAVAALIRRATSGRSQATVIFASDTESVSGLILSRRNSNHDGLCDVLSYWALPGWEGRGIMAAGLLAYIAQSNRFGDVAWLEAQVEPSNHRSTKLLKRNGFTSQGQREMLMWHGWRDVCIWRLPLRRYLST
tara:strand:+ start:4587 stop:5069 length:483 start_codon:yes stop_codon:yes gene_type:complete